MLSDREHSALLAMQGNILLALRWTGTLSESDFAEDRMTFYAVTRALEILSEASRRLPDTLKDRHPAYPWRKMRVAGNVYRHDYEGVSEQFVFDTVKEALPPLLLIVERELAAAR